MKATNGNRFGLVLTMAGLGIGAFPETSVSTADRTTSGFLHNSTIKLNALCGIPVVDGVFLNGHGPYRFLIDTGAQTNQVEESIARELRFAPSFQVEMATAAGAIRVPGNRVAEVSLGSATASNQEFRFTTLEGAPALAAEIQGILGQEFLAHFDYLLDFAQHRLVFGEPAPEGGNRVPFETIDGCPVIETSEGKLVMGSGTDSTILYRSSFSGPHGPIIRMASGTASVSPIQNLRLRIAGRNITLPTRLPSRGRCSGETAYSRPACSTPFSSAMPANSQFSIRVSKPAPLDRADEIPARGSMDHTCGQAQVRAQPRPGKIGVAHASITRSNGKARLIYGQPPSLD